MAFVRHSVTTIPIPHEPGNTVTIKRPRRALLAAAADLRQEKALTRVRALGGTTFLADLRAAQLATADPTPTAAPVVEAAPPVATEPTPAEIAAAFDQDALLLAGILSWAGPDYDGVAVDADAIADLDPVTAQWLAEQIAVYAAAVTRKNG